MKKLRTLTERNMEIRSEMQAIGDKAKAEKRNFTPEEAQRLEQLREEHNRNAMEIMDITSTEQYRQAHGKERTSLMQLLRNARNTEGHTVVVPAFTEMMRSTISAGNNGTDLVETEFKGLLEPLYAESVLAKLGARFYPGLPQGNIHVPIMGKSSCNWAGETGNSSDGAPDTSSVELTPHRLTSYIDISKQLLNQDSIGIEEAIRRDLVKSISDKFEATVFGAEAGSVNKPKGLFWDASASPAAVRTLEDGTDFAKACEIDRIQNFPKKIFHYADLFHCSGRESPLLAVQHLGIIRDVHGVIADTLEIRHNLIVLVEDRGVLLSADMGQKFYDVTADAVREKVNIRFRFLNLLINLCIIILNKAESLFHIVPCCAVLRQQNIVKASQRQCGRIEESRAERVELVLILVRLYLIIGHKTHTLLLKQPDHGEEQHACRQVKYCIGIRDDTGIDGSLPDPVQESELMKDRHADKDQRHFTDIEEDIDDTDPLLLRACADKAHDSRRHAVAEVYADNNRVYRLKGKHARGGKRLQDTDRG